MRKPSVRKPRRRSYLQAWINTLDHAAKTEGGVSSAKSAAADQRSQETEEGYRRFSRTHHSATPVAYGIPIPVAYAIVAYAIVAYAIVAYAILSVSRVA
jgi:hypothetical protein